MKTVFSRIKALITGNTDIAAVTQAEVVQATVESQQAEIREALVPLACSQGEIPALVAVAPPAKPDKFTSGNNEPPHYMDVKWSDLVDLAMKREIARQDFFNRLSMCAGIWFLWTGGLEHPRTERPVDLNIRWQRLPDGRFILADFARLGFWGDDIESVLARTMMDILIPLDAVACSEIPDADGLYHSSILRGSWQNTIKPEGWLSFLDDLDAKYYHSWFGSDVRGAREALETFGAIPKIPPSERPATLRPVAPPSDNPVSIKQEEPLVESSNPELRYPIPPLILESFVNLRGLFDECGYALSYERTTESRPEGHQFWKWAKWKKAWNQSRIEIMLGEFGGLDVWCHLHGCGGIEPKIQMATFSLNYSTNQTRELSPADVKQIESLVDKWMSTLVQSAPTDADLPE